MQERTILDTLIGDLGPSRSLKCESETDLDRIKLHDTLDFEAMILQKNAYSGTNDGESLIDRSYE